MQKDNKNSFDCEYLVKENRKLRMELKEAISVKELHQQALIELNQKFPESRVISTLVDIIRKGSNSARVSELNELVMQLEGKALVLEKIARQAEENEQETYSLLAAEMEGLRRENLRKEEQLHKFYEKIGEVDYLSGLVTKYREITSVDEQSAAFKRETAQLLDALNIQQETIGKLQAEKEKLLRINVHMKEEVEVRKDEVRNMTMILMHEEHGAEEPADTSNILGELASREEGAGDESRGQLESSQLSSSRLAMLSRLNSSSAGNSTANFLKMQRELIREASEEDEAGSSEVSSDLDCPELSALFPDKVQRIIRQKQRTKVPYLNMRKVREMMARREEKIRAGWEQQKDHVNPTAKIIQLESELQITRKELANLSLKFRVMEEHLKKLNALQPELESRNEHLAESNLRLRNNYQIVYKDYQSCRSLVNHLERKLGLTLSKQSEAEFKAEIDRLQVPELVFPAAQRPNPQTLRDQPMHSAVHESEGVLSVRGTIEDKLLAAFTKSNKKHKAEHVRYDSF